VCAVEPTRTRLLPPPSSVFRQPEHRRRPRPGSPPQTRRFAPVVPCPLAYPRGARPDRPSGPKAPRGIATPGRQTRDIRFRKGITVHRKYGNANQEWITRVIHILHFGGERVATASGRSWRLWAVDACGSSLQNCDDGVLYTSKRKGKASPKLCPPLTSGLGPENADRYWIIGVVYTLFNG